MHRLGWLLLLLAFALPAQAQDRAPLPWTLVRDAQSCTSVLAQPDGDTRLLLVKRPGSPYRVIVEGPGWNDLPEGEARIALSSWGGFPPIVSFDLRSRADGPGMVLTYPGPGHPIVSTTALRLADRRGARSAGIAVNTAAHAVARLVRCADEIARVDIGSGAPAVADPRPIPAPLLTADDYPPAALRAELEGRVTVALTVSAKGQVSGCDVTGSSGWVILDETTCRIYSRRARFTPALDASGEPTQAVIHRSINWTFPREP